MDSQSLTKTIIRPLTADGFELDPNTGNVVFVRIEDTYHGAHVKPEWMDGAWRVDLGDDIRLVRHMYRKRSNALRALVLERQDEIIGLISQIETLTSEAAKAEIHERANS